MTVELLGDGRWRGRFLLPFGTKLPREIDLAFADGRHGRATVDHIHPALSKKGPRLVDGYRRRISWVAFAAGDVIGYP